MNFIENVEKKEYEEFVKKLLTDWGILRIINLFAVSENRIWRMESWLSGRRRTIGNRVGVMSVSRVQIPNSPP